MKTITNLWKSFFGKGFAAVFSDFAKYDAEGTEIHTALSSKVSDVTYDGTAKKLTKTVDGTTSDVVTAATLKADMSLDNVDNKSAATLKSEFTGAVAQDNTGFATGGDVYTAIGNNGKGLAIFEIDAGQAWPPPSGELPTYSEIDAKVNAGFRVILRVTTDDGITTSSLYFELSASLAPGAYLFVNYSSGGSDIIAVYSDNTWERQFIKHPYISQTANGVGSSNQPVYVNSSGQVTACGLNSLSMRYGYSGIASSTEITRYAKLAEVGWDITSTLNGHMYIEGRFYCHQFSSEEPNSGTFKFLASATSTGIRQAYIYYTGGLPNIFNIRLSQANPTGNRGMVQIWAELNGTYTGMYLVVDVVKNYYGERSGATITYYSNESKVSTAPAGSTTMQKRKISYTT